MSIRGLGGAREDLFVETEAELPGLFGGTNADNGRSESLSEESDDVSESSFFCGCCIRLGTEAGEALAEFALVKIDARRAAASGVNALVEAEARVRGVYGALDWLAFSGSALGCLANSGLGRSSRKEPCPISDCVRTAGPRCVMVRSRLSFWVGSLSTSSSSSDSDSDESEEDCRAELFGREDDCAVELRIDRGLSIPETAERVDTRFLLFASRRNVSAADGGRNEGTGEFARLFRACASRNAATEMR